MNIKKKLGLKIKEYRKRKKLPREQLSELIGLDSGYLSKLEVGQNFPTLGTLEKIAKILDVELYELFRFTQVAKDSEKDFVAEIVEIYSKLNKEKQYTLYRVAKDLL